MTRTEPNNKDKDKREGVEWSACEGGAGWGFVDAGEGEGEIEAAAVPLLQLHSRPHATVRQRWSRLFGRALRLERLLANGEWPLRER